MKKFLIKFFVLSAIISSIFLLLAHAGRPDIDPETHPLGALIYKHQRLKDVSGRRLIFVGGSSVSFGIDSEKIEQNTGYSVVNLGIHAGLGIEFLLNEIIENVRPNDVILLMPEFQLYTGNDKLDPALIRTAQWILPEAESYYRFSPFEKIEILHRQFKRLFTREKEIQQIAGVYRADSYNKYGDMIAHLDIDTPTMLVRPLDDEIVPAESIAAWDRFWTLSEKCRALNARVFIVMPNYPTSQYRKNKAVIDQVFGKIKKELSFIPVLGDPTTFLVDDSDLFDTVYHLNARGRQKKTDRVIQLLRDNNLAP